MTWEEAVKVCLMVVTDPAATQEVDEALRPPESRCRTRRASGARWPAVVQYNREWKAWLRRAGWRQVYFLSAPWPPPREGAASLALVEPGTKGARMGFIPPWLVGVLLPHSQTSPPRRGR
jgi:hypothetical protein